MCVDESKSWIFQGWLAAEWKEKMLLSLCVLWHTCVCVFVVCVTANADISRRPACVFSSLTCPASLFLPVLSPEPPLPSLHVTSTPLLSPCVFFPVFSPSLLHHKFFLVRTCWWNTHELADNWENTSWENRGNNLDYWGLPDVMWKQFYSNFIFCSLI